MIFEPCSTVPEATVCMCMFEIKIDPQESEKSKSLYHSVLHGWIQLFCFNCFSIFHTGGNCNTAMIAALSLDEENLPETIATCRVAQRVARILNKPV